MERLAAEMVDHTAQLGIGDVVAAPPIRVERISQQRETRFCQMNSDLVRPPGLLPQLYE